MAVLSSGEFVRAREVVERAIAQAAFPAAVVEVGDAVSARWREPFGALTCDPDASPTREDTLFDLASLTKVIATTTLAMQLHERGRLDLDAADPTAGCPSGAPGIAMRCRFERCWPTRPA